MSDISATIYQDHGPEKPEDMFIFHRNVVAMATVDRMEQLVADLKK